MTVNGKVVAVYPVRRGETMNGTWVSKDFLMEYKGHSNRTKKILLTIRGDSRINYLKFGVGDVVDAFFDLDADEWGGRWRPTISVYDVRVREPAVAPVEEKAEETPNVVYAKNLHSEGTFDF